MEMNTKANSKTIKNLGKENIGLNLVMSIREHLKITKSTD